jgi:hypothetical protein
LFAQNGIVASPAPLPLIFQPKNSLTILITSKIIPLSPQLEIAPKQPAN